MNCMYQSAKESGIVRFSCKCDQLHRYLKEERKKNFIYINSKKFENFEARAKCILWHFPLMIGSFNYLLATSTTNLNLTRVHNVMTSLRNYNLTTGSGASHCWHIIQGTPVFWETAIFAAHKAYFLPSSL